MSSALIKLDRNRERQTDGYWYRNVTYIVFPKGDRGHIGSSDSSVWTLEKFVALLPVNCLK